MSFTEPGGVHSLLGEVPALPRQEAEGVRDLAMRAVLPYATRVHRQPERNATKYLFYHNSGGQVGSSLVDEMMGVVVRRNGPRQNSLRISFLELVLSDEERYTNHREVYAFDWLKGSEIAIAHKIVTENFGKILETKVDGFGETTDTVLPYREVAVMPIETTDCDDLCNRMLGFALLRTA